MLTLATKRPGTKNLSAFAGTCMGMLWLACAALPAYAQGPRIGVELERERDSRSGIRNRSLTVKPGWQFAKDSLINVAELLIDRNEDTRADSDGIRARETKLFLRLRHNGALTESTGYYLRGGIGRSFNNSRDFTYAYVEPGLVHELDSRWEWVFGWREIDAVDGTPGERVRKYITGPSYNLDRRREIELRYVRARRDDDSWSWSIGYVHRF